MRGPALRRRFPTASLTGALAGGIVGVACLVPPLRAVLTDADRGLDAMDESHYLMAAQPWAADKAFNGIFGWYSGPLWRLVGRDLGTFRVLSAVLLLAAAAVLAGTVRRFSEHCAGRAWPPWLRGAWPPACLASALSYYTVFVRTPSYNWFAAVGLMLLGSGLLAVLDQPRSLGGTAAWGGVIAFGTFVTAVGKGTTAAAAAAVLLSVAVAQVITGGRRGADPRAVVAAVAGAAAAAGLLVGVHLRFVHSAAFTLATYHRVAGMLAAVDPGHYAGGAVSATVRAGLLDVVRDRPGTWLLLVGGLAVSALTAVAGRRRWRPERSAVGLAAAFAALVAAVTLTVLADDPGGVPSLGPTSVPPVVIAEAALVLGLGGVLLGRTGTAGTAGTAGTGSRAGTAGRAGTGGGAGTGGTRSRPGGSAATQVSAGTAAMAGAALTAMGVLYPVGTNVEYATQLHGCFSLLLAGALVAGSALPGIVGSTTAAAAVTGAALALGVVLVPTTRAVAPYRIAPLGEQRLPRVVASGAAPVLVDPDTAAWVDDLRSAASAAGFRPGTPMLDLTWHPASVLVLDGRAPRVLLPAFPGWPDPAGSAAYALRQEDPTVWRRAWLLVPEGQPDSLTDGATRVLDRTFPGDYERVAVVVAPYDRQQQGLWRPRRP